LASTGKGLIEKVDTQVSFGVISLTVMVKEGGEISV
jgi:hypothetical protein